MDASVGIRVALLGGATMAVVAVTFVPTLVRNHGPGADDPLAPPRPGGQPGLVHLTEAESAELTEPLPLAAVIAPEATASRAPLPAPPASLIGTWSWGAGSAGTIVCGSLLQQPFPLTGVVSISGTPNDHELLWTDSDEDGTCVLRLLKQGDAATLAPGQSCSAGPATMSPTALTVRRTGPHRLQISGAGAISARQFAALGVPCSYQMSATLLLQR